MKFRAILTIVPVMLAAAPQFVRGEDKRSFGLSEKMPDDDLTCAAVYEAYRKTHNSGQMIDLIYEVTAREQLKPFETVVSDGALLLERMEPGSRWEVSKRSKLNVDTNSKTIFRNCRFLGEEWNGGKRLALYVGDWERGLHVASIKIWVSTQSGKFAKTRRDYAPYAQQFDFSSSIELYYYDRDVISQPRLLSY